MVALIYKFFWGTFKPIILKTDRQRTTENFFLSRTVSDYCFRLIRYHLCSGEALHCFDLCSVHYIRLCSANKVEPTLPFKPREDITRNPKQGHQWPQNRASKCVHQRNFKNFFLKKVQAVSVTRKELSHVIPFRQYCKQSFVNASVEYAIMTFHSCQ